MGKNSKKNWAFTSLKMDYTKTKTEDFFKSIISNWNGDSEAAWLQAENLMELRELFIKWYKYIENGEAENIYPDPFFKKNISQELADNIINIIENDFLLEKGRWEGLKVNSGPGYTRLSPSAKIAFVQQISKIYKNTSQILKETNEKREEIKERFPRELIGYLQDILSNFPYIME